jgi:hypothetical protein
MVQLVQEVFVMNADLSRPLQQLAQRHRSCHRNADEEVPWAAQLPREWSKQVVAPLCFSRFRDYEILSERVVGYEDAAEEEPCYCEHYFVLTDIRSDDDEIYYVVPSYWEHLVAWRLCDGRWLIHRRISCSDDCQQHQSFFSFAEAMPR